MAARKKETSLRDIVGEIPEDVQQRMGETPSSTSVPRRSSTTTVPPKETITTEPVSPTTTVPVDITKLSPEKKLEYLAEISGGANQGTTGLPSNYIPPTRRYTDDAGQVREYSGNQLINLSTGKTQPMYKINIDPTAVIGTKLSESGPQGLLKFLKQLESLGFYQGGRIGNGTSDNDVSAVAGFLRYANMQGLVMDSALVVAQQQIPPYFRVGQGGPQVTNADDLKAVFESVAMSVLGRGISDSQLNAMVSAYQQQERSASYGGAAAPQAQTYATNALRQKFKGEAQDFRAMNVADSMLNIIRSS